MMNDASSNNAERPANIEMLVPPPALSAAPTPLSLLKALRKRWPLALACASILGIGAAAVAWFFAPEGQYTARTTLHVPAQSVFLAKDAVPGLSLADHQKLQIAMVKSRLVLSSALKEPSAAGLALLRDKTEPIEWLERELQADFNSAPEVLRIALTGKDRDDLIKLVQAIRLAYCREVLDKEIRERTDRQAELRKYHEFYKTKLEVDREERKKLEALAGGPEPVVRTMVLAFSRQRLIGLESELLHAEAGIRRTKAELAGLEIARKEGSEIAAPETLIEERLAKDPGVQSLTAKINQKRADIEEARAVVNPGQTVPRIHQMQREIEESEKALNDLKPKLLPRITDEIKKQVQNNIELTERELRFKSETLEKERAALELQVAAARENLQKQMDGGGALESLRDTMTHVEDLCKSLAREEQKLDLEIRAAPPRYKILEEGLATRPPENKRRLMLTAGSGLAVFGAVMALFALVEFRVRRVGSPEEMSYGLGLPVVATIPDNTVKKNSRKGNGDAKPLMNEAIDTFRTMLIRAGEHERMRVVMITSAQSGEGKTSLSTHLAASLANVGYSTLLLDGDLRNPLAHRVFELDTTPGLCDLLRSDSTLEELIRPTPIDRLWMITAGEWDGAASRGLARDRIRELVENLRSRFDYVIIDSSPVLPVVDPLLLGTWADGAVISVLREKSRMPLVYAAYQRLAAGGVRVLGTVVNGVHGEQYGSYYAYRDQSVEA